MQQLLTILILLCGMLPMWADPPSAVHISAAEMINAGRVDDVLKLLSTQIKSSPQDAYAYNLLSRTYFSIQRWDDAITAGERAVALEPGNSAYHMWLGRAYAEKADHSSFLTAAGLTKKIRQEFERAVELDASNLDARTDLAEFYIEAPGFMGGGKDRAQQQAQTISRQDAATAHWLQARIAQKDKQYDLAEKEYKAAIEASGNDGRYWLNLGSFYKRTRRYADMEAAITKAISATKNEPNVFYDAASLLYDAGRNFPGAANLIRKYLAGGALVEQAPAVRAHYLLGQVLERQGDHVGALQEYRAALATARDFDHARDAVARLERR